MAELLTNTTDLTKVADAIREKGGTSDSLVYPDGFVTAIQAIQTGTELQIIVSVTSGAIVTATKGSLSVSGTSVDGTCTLTVPEEGEWTVSATKDGATTAPSIVVISTKPTVQIVFADPVLNNNSWSDIAEISDQDLGANYWSVGDCKGITINGTIGTVAFSNYTCYAFIIGFDHNAEIEGSNRIHFQMAKTAAIDGVDICFCDSAYNTVVTSDQYFCMNKTDSNLGTWGLCSMRTNLNGTIKNQLPEDLRAVLKTVEKYTVNRDLSTGDRTQDQTTDYMFLLSEYEIFGTEKNANIGESENQEQYAYYSAGNSKVKYRHDSQATAVIWWLRSQYRGNAKAFAYVSASGVTGFVAANRSLGLAPGFCV